MYTNQNIEPGKMVRRARRKFRNSSEIRVEERERERERKREREKERVKERKRGKW